MTKYLILIIPLLSPISTQAQLSFTNSAAALSLDGFHSGVAIAITDVNDDGLDDIVHLQEGKDLYVEYQQADGSFAQVFAGNMSSTSEWSMCVGDIDNNGFADVFSGGNGNGIKLAKANVNGNDFDICAIPNSNIFVQGSNFVDINNDGHLDIFACHDNGESKIWENDGAGNFSPANHWIDMSTTPLSDNSGNYGSIWSDFDNDGDLDLYIAKCRQGVYDSSDPRRINMLFENDGNGNFTENAAAYGLDIGAQSWTADFADYDNDGDFDCFITNHDIPSLLLRNDNGYFNDVTVSSGINVIITPVQGIMEDFDNDGFVDLLVAGEDEQFFHNDGDGTFTEMDLFDDEHMESFGIGDLNHDGFLDIYAGYASMYTSPSDVDDAIWLNNGNNHNFIAVKLQGVMSNQDGIGARVEIHGNWGIQIREVRAGEGYGIVNSTTQNFGIGQNTSIDRLIVKWTSGIIDTVENPMVNQFITIVENNCVAPTVTISTNGSPVLCPNATLDLTAPSGYEYEWSTGATSQNISINQAGYYALTITDNDGCPAYTSINILPAQDETPTIVAEGNISFCEGGSVTLTSSATNGCTWSNGATSQSITVYEPGSYSVIAHGICDDFPSEPIMVEVLSAPIPETENMDIEEGQSVTLNVEGENIHWYDAPFGGNMLGEGTTYTTAPLAGDAVYYVEDWHETGGDNFDTGALEHAGSDYSGSAYNGAIIFDALREFKLKTVKVYTDTPGNRTIELRNEEGTVLQSTTIHIANPEEIISLDFNIMPGENYSLTTNGSSNNIVFGDDSPELKRSNDNVNYPYLVDHVVNIKGSNLGSFFYYYFYDWKIELPTITCISERASIYVDVNTTVDVEDIETSNEIKIYPNPSSGFIHLDIDFPFKENPLISIVDLTGKTIMDIPYSQFSAGQGIDLSHLTKGIYSIKLSSDHDIYTRKIILQ